MRVHQSQPSDDPDRDLLARLIRQKTEIGAKPFSLFFVTGEGRYLPQRIHGERVEEASGYVVDVAGEVFRFWLGWDSQHEAPALTIWRRVRPAARWATDAEYREAR